MTAVTSAVVIADSTCLIGLAKISRLELLPALFGRITLAPAVWHEVVVQGQGRSGSAEIENANWIDITEVRNPIESPVSQAEHTRVETRQQPLAEIPFGITIRADLGGQNSVGGAFNQERALRLWVAGKASAAAGAAERFDVACLIGKLEVAAVRGHQSQACVKLLGLRNRLSERYTAMGM